MTLAPQFLQALMLLGVILSADAMSPQKAMLT
jgi:hypothetical protein